MLPLADVIHLAITGLAQGCAYGLIALGFVLVYKATEVVNFAHGEFMMLGAFAVLAFSEGLGWGFWPAFVAGCLSIAVVGYLIDAQIMRRIIGQSSASIFILTVAFGFIFRSLAGMIWGWNTLSLSTPFDGKISVGSLDIATDRIAIVVATIILCGLLYLFFSRTRFGIAMQASSQNQLAAYYMGIPVKRLVSLTWAIGALIAAAAGALLAPVTQVDTTIGLLGIKALAGAIVGGFGSIPGALLGCLLIGLIEPFADYYFPAIKGVSAYVVMLVVLFVRPEGLVVQTFQKKV
ncbi:MAG: branched-chain amino acid ABC transporter permease [Xanthomonadales bacterium]|nr:branched-chain amino acid ABC transporter permease [Xanthomonadales bacterium]